MRSVLTPKVRRWIYGIALAAAPVAVYFGWISLEASPLFLALILAVLNVNPDDDTPAD